MRCFNETMEPSNDFGSRVTLSLSLHERVDL
jgi:hypothetical protein